MKQNTISQRALLFFGLGLLVLIIAAFLWMWFGVPRPLVESFKSAENLAPISVSGVEARGQKLLDGLINNSGIPIPEPVGKEGRADPFAAL